MLYISLYATIPTSWFDLTTPDSYSIILVQVFMNHILVKNKYFMNHIELTEHKIMVLAFKICLGTQQLPELMLRESCIFSNVGWQIIAGAKLS